MRIMQWGDSRMKMVSAVVIILLCVCINTACGNKDSEKNDEEAGYLEEERVSLRDVEETEETGEKEDAENESSDGEAEQAVFTTEDLPEEIKALLNYESWTDGTQAIFQTEEDMKNSGMPEEFQQIINGDFSGVRGLRDEEGRKELKEDYEKRESWAYMTRDMDGDGIEELCMKDSKGRIGIFFEVWDSSYMPGMIEIWSFGEHESNLLTEEDWGANDYFLNNGQFAMMFKCCDRSNSYFDIETAYLSRVGTFPIIEKMNICIINDTFPSPGYVVNYENPGIYYEVGRYEGEEYIQEEVTEQEAVAWCENNIYPYMMSEEEWYAVP